ncbi:MAG: FlgD immunoglobulin-like domain containing protein, partial [Acidobacteriota bacterium]
TGRSRAVVSVVGAGGAAGLGEIDAGPAPPPVHPGEAAGAGDPGGGGGFERGGGEGDGDLGAAVDRAAGTVTWVVPPSTSGGSFLTSPGEASEKADFGPTVRRLAAEDGALISEALVRVEGGPFDAPPVPRLARSGDALSVLVDPGAFPFAPAPGDGEADREAPKNLIPAMSETERLRFLPAPTRSSVREKSDRLAPGQHLVRWQTAESRELPLRVGDGLWTAEDKFLVADVDAGEDFEGRLPYYTSAANLTGIIRPRVLFGDAGVDLWLVATDRHLDRYELHYADLDELSADGEPVYRRIGLPSSEPLFGERWGTWLPPGNGRYRVRLTLSDLAGNERQASRRVVWNGDTDIANLHLEARFLSPRTSPGERDQLVFHYTVLRPANLDFAILDADGQVVARLPTPAPTPGPMSTIFSGDDASGAPLPDGEYSLTLGDASWPFVIDNSPPEVSLLIADAVRMDGPRPQGLPMRDLFVHEIFASVRDVNLLRWSYEQRLAPAGEWVEVTGSDVPLERDGANAWRLEGAAALAGRELRLVASDLAGNRTVVSRSKRDELLRFTDAEPACRGLTVNPCGDADRPPVDGLGDGDGLLLPGGRVLDPDFDSLLVQSTVWVGSAVPEISLEYRRLSTAGGPPGAWVDGEVEQAAESTRRSICTEDSSLLLEGVTCARVEDEVIRLYWRHPDLEPTRYEVRLSTVNIDGARVRSEPLVYQPARPLRLEHLGVDHRGDLLLVTNTSSDVVSTLSITRKELGVGGERWVSSIQVQTPAIEPGGSRLVEAGCLLVDRSGELLRAEGFLPTGDEAISLPVRVPDRQGFPELRSEFFVGTCDAAGAGPFGRGFLGDEHVQPCAVGPLDWPRYWVGRGDGPRTVRGFIPADPAGVAITSYRLDVDGLPVLRLDGPFSEDGTPYEATVDLSGFGEGDYVISEHIGYAIGNEGLLATCPGSFPLHIDRTPPEVTIDAPLPGAVVCPEDGGLDVALTVDDVTLTAERVLVDGADLAGRAQCSPYGAPGGTYTVAGEDLEAGLRDLEVKVSDQAGNITCASVEVVVPPLPRVEIEVRPTPFSPVNTAGRPIAADLRFETRSPGTFELTVFAADGASVHVLPPTDTDGGLLSAAWDGTDFSGDVAPDAPYTVEVIATSACGASASATATAVLDTTPPTVALTTPSPGADIGASADLRGLARDLHFERYEVQVRSASGGEWQAVSGDTRPTGAVAAPLGVWQTGDLPAGPYQLRLYAVDAAGNEAWSPEVDVTVRPRRFIRRVERSPELFSPNADGTKDTTALTVDVLASALLTVEVVDSTGELVATVAERVEMAASSSGTWTWSGASGGPDDFGPTVDDGAYAWVVTAEDPSSPPALPAETESLGVVVDTLPPALDLVEPADDALIGPPLRVVGGVDELHPDLYSLELEALDGDVAPLGDGEGAFAARELVSTAAEDGAYGLVFRAEDRAGNTSRRVHRIVLDATAPDVAWEHPLADAVLSTVAEPVTLAGRIREDNLASWAFAYAVGANPADGDFLAIHGESALPTLPLADGPVTWAWDASGLADGPYTLRLTAVDALGRAVEARRRLVVDTTPPAVAIDVPALDEVLFGPIDVEGSAVDANPESWRLEVRPASGGAAVLLGSGVEASGGVLAPWPVLPENGAYVLRLEAQDRAGLTAAVEVPVTVAVTPPEPPVLESATPVGTDVALVWRAGAGPEPAAYRVHRDGAPITPDPVTSTAYVDPALADGAYTYTVTALDAAGTETAPSNALTAVVDAEAPVARIQRPEDGNPVSDLVDVVGTAHRATGFAGWTLEVRPVPGSSWQVIGAGTAPVLADRLATWDTVSFADGPYDLRLRAEAANGAAATHEIRVEVDNAEPAPPVLTVAVAQAQDVDGEVNDAHVEWTLDPSPADLAGFFLYRDGQLANAPGPVVGSATPFLLGSSPYDDADLPDGTYIYAVTAVDAAGNESATSNPSAPVVIETRRPRAVIVDPADGHFFETPFVSVAEVSDLDVVSVRFEARPEGSGPWSSVGAPLSAPPWRVTFDPASLGFAIPGRFELRAVASDAIGPDPAPPSITVEQRDLPPDGAPEVELRVDGGEVALEWRHLEPPADLAGYRVYRDGVLLTLTDLPAAASDFVDTGDGAGLADDDYLYRVAPVDAAGQEGTASDDVLALVTTPEIDHRTPVTDRSELSLSTRIFAHGAWIDVERRLDGGVYEVVLSVPGPDTGETVTLPPVELAPGYQSLRVRGRSDAGDRTWPSRELVMLAHPRPQEPLDFEVSVAADDVTLTWSPNPGPGPDPALFGFAADRGGAPLAASTSTFPYDAVDHGLTASSGDPSAWARAVDGDAFSVWQPDPAGSGEIFFEWTWPDVVDDVFLDAVDLRFRTAPFAFSVDLRVDGRWLWWHHEAVNFSSLVRVELGAVVDGVRLRIPRNACFSCRLAEVELSRLTLPTAPPLVDAGRPAGVFDYGVVETNRYGQRSSRATATAAVGVVAPPPAVDVTATASGCAEISVTWSAPTPAPAGLSGFRIEREAAAGGFAPWRSVGPTELNAVDRGLAVDVDYAYRVRTAVTVMGGGELVSEPSAAATATATCDVPPPPELLEPPRAGVPVVWPLSVADVGGRAHPGSWVTLLHDGESIRTLRVPASTPDVANAVDGLLTDPDRPWAIDGGRLAFIADGADGPVLRVVDLSEAGEPATAVVEQAMEEPGELAISSDGATVAFIDRRDFRRELWTLDVETGGASPLVSDGDGEPATPRFAPNGRAVFFTFEDFSSGDGLVLRADLSTGALETVYRLPFTSLQGLGLSPAGDLAIVGTWEGPKIVNLGTGRTVQEIWTYRQPTFPPRPFSADGAEVLFLDGTYSPGTTEVHIADVETGDFESLDPGFLGAAFAGPRTLALVRTGADGRAQVLGRSLVDDVDTVWLEGLDVDALPGPGAGGGLAGLADGRLAVAERGRVQRLDRAGGDFVFPDVALSAGVNVFIARQDLSLEPAGTGGASDSQPSAPIEVEVAPATFGNARVVEVLASPGLPLVGQTVTLQGEASNDGVADLAGVVARWLHIRPDGTATAVAERTLDLAAGAVELLRHPWAGAEAGDHRFELLLDPDGLLVELDESDNRAGATVRVRETVGVGASLSGSSSEVALGESLTLWGQLESNAPPAPTDVSLVIETPSGGAVAEVATWSFDAFGAEVRELPAVWSSAEVYPAPYVARLEARQGGAVVAEATLGFEVTSSASAEVSARA